MLIYGCFLRHSVRPNFSFFWNYLVASPWGSC